MARGQTFTQKLGARRKMIGAIGIINPHRISSPLGGEAQRI